jgi:hypothetical protein
VIIESALRRQRKYTERTREANKLVVAQLQPEVPHLQTCFQSRGTSGALRYEEKEMMLENEAEGDTFGNNFRVPLPESLQ